MAAEQIATRFIVDEQATPNQQELLSSLELGINNSPELYDAAFSACMAAIAEDVTQAMRIEAQYLRNAPADSDAFPNVFDNWLSFMRLRLDRFLEFDPETEAEISKSSEFADLRDNKDLGPEQRRDAARSFRMHAYMGKVALSKEQLDSVDEQAGAA